MAEEKDAKKATLDDFRIVDKFIDEMTPAWMDDQEVREVRRAWGRILLTYGDAPEK